MICLQAFTIQNQDTKTVSSFLQQTSATLHNSSETIDHISNIEPTLKSFGLFVRRDASDISSKISFIEIS